MPRLDRCAIQMYIELNWSYWTELELYTLNLKLLTAYLAYLFIHRWTLIWRQERRLP